MYRSLQFHERSQHFIGAHDAVIRVYDAAGNVIATQEHKGDFKDCGSRGIPGLRNAQENHRAKKQSSQHAHEQSLNV